MMTAMAERRILVIDDELEMARSVCDGLGDRGFLAVPISSGREALELLRTEPFDAVVTDLRMPKTDGFEIIAASQRSMPDRPVIVMTAFSAVESAVESIRRGAYHYLTKPFKIDELTIFLQRALSERELRREASALKTALKERFSATAIVGQSEGMRRLRDLIERVADAPAPVLILGETGTGKGMVARALHLEGVRAAGPFVSVNCASLPESLLESELFGHVRGAFTSATSDRAGLFVEAHGGTLFLDEVGEMTAALQAKLLHVLERGVVRPLGSNKERAVDVRVVAATHRDLHTAASEGRFRSDLLYRLDVVSLTVPPLRDRREDLPLLVEHFLVSAHTRYPRSPVLRIGAEAMSLLASHSWPGNVRELAHVIERAVLLGRVEEIRAEDLPDAFRTPSTRPAVPFTGEILPIRELQRRYSQWALAQMNGHRGQTAERLGIDVKTLWSWLQPDNPSPE